MNLLDRQYLRLVDASIRQVARGPDVGADQTFDLVGIDTLSEALIGACSATAIATAADTSRSDVTGGSKLGLGFARAGDTSVSALAAAMNIESVTRRALTAITPKHTPGHR